jgi:enoyl-CoA hydratase/carnithine racemase
MSLIETTRSGAVQIISILRAEKKNALTIEMYLALTAALAAASNDDAVHVVLLRGAPGVFSAGNDLEDFLANPPEGQGSPVFQFLHALLDFPKALVASVSGPAVGIGTTLCMYCDGVVASESVKFILPFTALGLVPEAASSLLMPTWFGMQRASEWLLLGELITPQAALAAGLVNRVVPEPELDAASLAYAERYAKLPQAALRAGKALLRGHHRQQVRAAMKTEGDVFAARLRTPETQAILRSKLQKKP